MNNLELQSLYQRSNVEGNKQFQRLSEKTQVMMPQNGQEEVVKNRLTHSYEVGTSSLMMASNIAFSLNLKSEDIDYRGSLFSVSLLHDIGHSPFGHDGATYLDKYFKDLGVKDGFSDNNNNLVIIEKNNIVVSDYTTASVIKYPKKLYGFQKTRYIALLEKALAEDKEHFAKLGIDLKDQKLTIACQIMDEADRNSYACSDISDFLCLGNTIDLRKLHRIAKEEKVYARYNELTTLSNMIKSGSKGSIKAYFNELKNRFNLNYKLTSDGIMVIDKELEDYREFLTKICGVFYIGKVREEQFHKDNMKAFKQYIDDVVQGKYSPSETYTKKISTAKNQIQKYTYMRDMISEVSDWYILKYKEEMLKKGLL